MGSAISSKKPELALKQRRDIERASKRGAVKGSIKILADSKCPFLLFDNESFYPLMLFRLFL